MTMEIPSIFLKRGACLLVCTASLLASDIRPSTASVIINATQVGSNVVFNYSGDINTVPLGTPTPGGNTLPGFIYTGAFTAFGGDGITPASLAEYNAGTGSFFNLNTGGNFFTADSFTGDIFGVDSSMGTFVLLSPTYSSGAPITGSLTFNNTTISGLGLTDGTSYSGLISDSNDTITLNAGSAPVPGPLPILGIPAVLLYSRNLKKRIKARREASGASLT